MDERPLSYTLAVLWAMAAAFLMLLLMDLTVTFRPAAATDIVNLGAVEALAFTACTFALVRIYAAGRSARAALGLRPTSPLLSVLGLLLGVALQVPVGSLRKIVEHYTPTPDELLIAKARLLTADSASQFIAILVVTACVAPLVEELFVRGAMYGALVRTRPVMGAATMSGFCFVAVHWEWRNWLPLMVVAGALSHLRAASGSLLPGLALHVSFNAATVLALFTGFSSVTKPVEFSWPVTVLGWVATGVLVFAVQRVAQASSEAAAARIGDLR